MNPQMLTFHATPAQVQQFLVALRAIGTEVIPQPDGSYEIHGRTALGEIEATASYSDPTLTVSILKHGWNPVGTIEREIKQALAARYG